MAPKRNTRWHSTTRSHRRASGPEPQYQWPSDERILTYLREWLRSLDGLPGNGWSANSGYDQLVLVGHSLGGVILRRAMLDDYNGGSIPGSLTHTPGFSTKLALFSPATAGFGPSGLLGVLRETGFWGGINAVLSGSPAYNALSHPETGVLAELRRATVEAIASDPVGGLQAPTIWADPDGVVVVQSYQGDPAPRYALDRNHTGVCKPNSAYTLPRMFVEEVAT